MTSAAALRIEGVEAVAGATQIHTTFPGAGAALAAAALQQSDREVEPAILIAAGMWVASLLLGLRFARPAPDFVAAAG